MRKLIEDAVIAEGIQILVQRVALFSPEFDQRLAALRSDEAKASEMEHALKDEIHVKLEEDPAFYSSLRERLEQIIADRKAKRIDHAKQLELMLPLIEELAGRTKASDALGLSPAGLAVYGLLEEAAPLKAAERRDPRYREANRALAGSILDTLEPQMAIVDWTHKEDVQREMRRKLKRQLVAAKLTADRVEPLIKRIIELFKARQGR